MVQSKTQEELTKFIQRNPFNVQDKQKAKFNDVFGSQLTDDLIDDHAENLNELQTQAELEYQNLTFNINEFRKRVSENAFRNIVRAFKKLVANKDPNPKHQKELQAYYITEQSLIENFTLLFGYRCDVLAKVMYLKMGDNKIKAKINFYQFASVFEGLLQENPRDAPNKCIFNLLDIRSTGQLTILFLIQILHNI